MAILDMDDLDELSSSPPLRLGGPSRAMIAFGVLLFVGSVALAVVATVKGRPAFERNVICGFVALFGVSRIGVGTRSLVATNDALKFYGWFGAHFKDVRTSDIQRVELGAHVGSFASYRGDALTIHLHDGSTEVVAAEHEIADWLDARDIFVPDFGAWHGRYQRPQA